MQSRQNRQSLIEQRGRAASCPHLDLLLFVGTLSENIWQKEKEFNAVGTISIALAFLDTMCYQLYLLSSFSFVT